LQQEIQEGDDNDDLEQDLQDVQQMIEEER